MIPQLTVQVQGQGALSADAINTQCQTTEAALDLRAFPALTGMLVYVQGTAEANDGGAGGFYYDATSTATDDGVNVIAPAGQAVGRWLRLALNSAGATITGPEVDTASASTTDLGLVGSHLIGITGTVAITSLGNSANVSAPIYYLKFKGALTLTYNATTLIIPGAANITTANNDFAIVQYLGSGNWIVLDYVPAAGGSASFTFATSAQTKTGTSTTLGVTPAGLASTLQTDSMVYAEDTSGSPNTITLALTPAIASYVEGMRVAFKLASTVTGATNININGLGNKALQISGQAPAANSLLAGQIYTAAYDGSQFDLTSPPNITFWESSEITVTPGSNGTLSTGLPVAPKRIESFLRCKTAELGYLVGDELVFWQQFDGGGAHGFAAWIRGTSVAFQWGSGSIGVYTTSGNSTFITNANWRGFIRAWF